ncbi:MAG: PQQ-binding-like beta-propeller repeat protein, partial [Candidatus Binatia bacterium]
MRRELVWLGLGATLFMAAPTVSQAAASWERRMGDPQNSKSAGDDPLLSPATAPDLSVIATIPSKGKPVNATPIVSDGLLFFGDWGGWFYVIDLATRTRVVTLDTGTDGASLGIVGTYTGIQSTPTMATVSLPGGGEERRVYFGANSAERTLWCLNVTKILADKAAILAAQQAADGNGYVCAGASWPLSLTAEQPANPLAAVQETTLPPTTGVLHGSPLYRRA